METDIAPKTFNEMNAEAWRELFSFNSEIRNAFSGNAGSVFSVINSVYDRKNAEAVINTVIIGGVPVNVSLRTGSGPDGEIFVCLNGREVEEISPIDAGNCYGEREGLDNDEWEDFCSGKGWPRRKVINEVIEPYVREILDGDADAVYRREKPDAFFDFKKAQKVIDVLSDLGADVKSFAEELGLDFQE